MMTHDDVSDTGCPLKVMHTKSAKQIPFFNVHRFLPALILLQQGKVKQVPVRHYSAWQEHRNIILEQTVRTVYRLFCISLDEKEVYQLQH